MHKIILRSCCLAVVATLGLTAAVSFSGAAPSPPNLRRALDAQQRLALENPSNADTYNDLGNLLLLDGRLVEAEAAYLRAIELEPTDADHHYNLALLLDRRGDAVGALAALREAVRLDPTHAWAFYQLGTLLQQKRQSKLAVQAYAQAIYLNPDLASSQVNPHVIENSLLTEAMLLAYRKTSTQPMAPRTYEDGQRIAELMVQLQFDGPAPIPSGTDALSGNDTASRSGRSTMAVDPDEGDVDDYRSRTSVTAPPSSATSLGSTPTGGVAVGGSDQGATGQRVRSPGTVNPTTRSLRTQPNTDTSRPSPVRPPRGTRYVPRSTGSLELQLLPGQKKGEDRQS